MNVHHSATPLAVNDTERFNKVTSPSRIKLDKPANWIAGPVALKIGTILPLRTPSPLASPKPGAAERTSLSRIVHNGSAAAIHQSGDTPQPLPGSYSFIFETIRPVLGPKSFW